MIKQYLSTIYPLSSFLCPFRFVFFFAIFELLFTVHEFHTSLMDEVLDDEEFGEIDIVVNQRARSLRLRFVDGRLRATLPPWASEHDLRLFIDEVRPRLQKMIEKIHSEEASLVIDQDHPLQTLSFITNLSRSNTRKSIYYRLADGVLYIEVPERLQILSPEVQQRIKAGVEHFMRIEAKRLLPPRLQRLAAQWGFRFSDVKIQSSKTRWGSCNSRRNINLSLYLLLLPPNLIDSVLLHELCHTVEMNHGPRFWALMDKVTQGNAQQLRREIRRHRCRL